jgi:Flp pilus assembly pilin Flp
MALLRQFVGDDRGQDLIEYGLLCGFVTLGVVLAATNLGVTVNGIYGGIDTQMAAVPAP